MEIMELLDYWKDKYNECINYLNQINSKYDVDNTRSIMSHVVKIRATIGVWKTIPSRFEYNKIHIDLDEYYKNKPPDVERYIYNSMRNIYILRTYYNKKWKPEKIKNALTKKEYDKLYYKINAEKIKEYQKKYYNAQCNSGYVKYDRTNDDIALYKKIVDLTDKKRISVTRACKELNTTFSVYKTLNKLYDDIDGEIILRKKKTKLWNNESL
jgi:hypothetical protein